MTLQKNLKLAAYLLALIGLWAVTFTEYFPFFWPVASSAVVLASWFYKGAPKFETVIRRFWVAGGVLVVLFFPFDLFLSRSLLLPAVHISIFVQVYSLLNSKNEKAYRRILLVSFAQILASTNLTTDLRFGVLVSAYCAVAIYFVLLLYLFNGMTSDAQNTKSIEQEKAPQGILVFSLLLAAAMLPLSLSFFYSMPRLRYAIIARGNPIDSLLQMRQARQRTGFTKTVELGTYGRVQEDQTLALRVETPEGQPLGKNFKWRGGALNIYDGVVWSSSRDYFRYFDGKNWRVTDKNLGMTYSRGNSLFIVDDAFEQQASLDAEPNLLKQVFYLEIPYSDNLFGAGEIRAVQGPFTYGIGRDFNASFYIGNRQALPDLMSYTAYSYTNQPAPQSLRQVSQNDFRQFVNEGSYSDYVRKAFLQLPTSLNPQVRQLAEQITKDAESPYDKINAIQQFLVSRYTYSLDLEKPMTDDPLYDFLFLSRTGHCEYFATAMTILCRAIEIPARLAKGFQQGEWNDVGRFYEVRQRDSHAWVEVLFPQYGWVEFDPSPRAVADEYFTSRRSLLSRWMSKRLLQLQIFWRQNIVGYNETSRLRLIAEIKKWLRKSPESFVYFLGGLRDSMKSLSMIRLLLAFVTILLAPILIYLLRKFHGRLPHRLRFLRQSSRNPDAPAFYGKMLKLLRKKKIMKPAHLTPREFLYLPLLRRHPQFNQIELITSLYYRTRYGGAKLDGTDVAAIQTALAILRRNGQASGAASAKN